MKQFQLHIFKLTHAQQIHADTDDQEKGKQLGVCEDVLHICRPFYIPAVDECQ